MMVYLVERGVYSDRWILGVFSDLRKAKKNCPGKMKQVSPGLWMNDLDFEDAATIDKIEVE